MKLGRKKGPLYLQIKEILKERILNGIYPKHTNIPPEQELEVEFGVSKITIRNAVEQLVNEGYVEKRSGVGTTVLDNSPVSKLSKGQNFSEFLVSQGHQITKKQAMITIEDVTSHPVLASHYGEKCFRISRLYYLDNQPYIYYLHYIPLTLSLPLEAEVYQSSLYDLLYQKGVTFQRFKDEFSVVIPSQDVWEQLQIEQQPLLQRTRFAYDNDDQLIEYSVGYYNTNIHKYVVNFEV
ncbi:GntR family transcriptional regulator [Thermoflavimicrobium daqui]|jgi:DNA-binding GntR family transcriptional regulator|uniref:GntR family transcriptional regulator n=1 Tax=Thermoflavimicrobium daqui TaxID=2137476 RepID=A0A364K446_9BACL|nr:GntR family transcriptional regulator [Thermoflavimicrobium daqui]RAL24132.1 GntR family transcriptional regulator [Thermoflavimicrobium daqui]